MLGVGMNAHDPSVVVGTVASQLVFLSNDSLADGAAAAFDGDENIFFCVC